MEKNNKMKSYKQNNRQISEGDIIRGRITSIDKDRVLMDIGYTTEGQIRIHEFKHENGTVAVSAGDELDVFVEWLDEENEIVILSREKAIRYQAWDKIMQAFETRTPVEGVVTDHVNGGFLVNVGVRAFLPGSQASLGPVQSLGNLIGQKFKFHVLEYNRKENNVIVSRRDLLEHEQQMRRAATLKTLYSGKTVDGVVVNITRYGVFLDVGGVTGLMHNSCIADEYAKNLAEKFNPGDVVTVKVLDLDVAKGRISLGMLQDPSDRPTFGPQTDSARKKQSRAAAKPSSGTNIAEEIVFRTDDVLKNTVLALAQSLTEMRPEWADQVVDELSELSQKIEYISEAVEKIQYVQQQLMQKLCNREENHAS